MKKVVKKAFVAIGSDGKPYKIIESTEMLDDSSFGIPEKDIAGIKGYSLNNGTKLINVEGNKYNIMGTNVYISI